MPNEKYPGSIEIRENGEVELPTPILVPFVIHTSLGQPSLVTLSDENGVRGVFALSGTNETEVHSFVGSPIRFEGIVKVTELNNAVIVLPYSNA
jgi:hypothetical protein